MFNDRPIHLLEFDNICRKVPNAEPSVSVPVWITQSSLDGLQALIRYCDGYEHNGRGRVQGSFELVMFYRTLQDCISKANDNAAPSGDASRD